MDLDVRDKISQRKLPTAYVQQVQEWCYLVAIPVKWFSKMFSCQGSPSRNSPLGVLKNIFLKTLQKFTGRHLSQSLFNSIEYLRTATLRHIPLWSVTTICQPENQWEKNTIKSHFNFQFSKVGSALNYTTDQFSLSWLRATCHK